MYHIKPDKRSQQSARLICEGLISCLKKKSFDKITITDIQKESNVGRATFYRLFDNISDVLSYQWFILCLNVVENQVGKEHYSTKELILSFIQNWIKNELLLETIWINNRIDIIITTLNNNKEILTELFFKNSNLDEEKKEYLTSTAIVALVSAVMFCFGGKKERNAEKIYDNMKESCELLIKFM